MSSVIAKNIQIGADTTATNNFTIYQPATPNGTLLIGNGNTGITSSLVALTSAGNLGLGTSSPTAKLDVASGNIYVRSGITYSNTISPYSGDLTIDYGSSPNILKFTTGATTRATLDSSGNLGLGVTPSAWGGFKAFEFPNGASIGQYSTVSTLFLNSNAYFNGSSWIYKTSAGSSRYQVNTGTHEWFNAPSGTAGNAISFTQAMTLDASGNLLVGTTSNNLSGAVSRINVQLTATERGIALKNGASGTHTQISFVNAAGSLSGYINVSDTATTYATSSDYRLKEDIVPMTGALNRVAALKPVIYKWKIDGSSGEGFIAHELAEVCPAAVTGEKDAVDAEGNPHYQGIDVSFLVGTLTAAIQEQQALIQSLQADVAALKAAA